MKRVIFLTLAFCLVGCTTVKNQYNTAANTYKKMDHDRDYLHPENFVAERVHIPEGLSDKSFEDFYSVPTVASKSSNTVPSVKPPEENTLKG